MNKRKNRYLVLIFIAGLFILVYILFLNKNKDIQHKSKHHFSKQYNLKESTSIETSSEPIMDNQNINNDKTIEIKKDNVLYKRLDIFNKPLQWKEYKTFRGEYCISKDGYGIYYDKAKISISWDNIDNTNKVMRIKYNMPYYKKWGNWISIVKEYDKIQNLNDYNGLCIVYKNISSSKVIIRLTLRDILNSPKINEINDEMWWFDDFDKYITDIHNGWITVKIPFNKFYLAKGEGTRHNDKRLDLNNIKAYEVNLISSGKDKMVNGEAYIRSVKLYLENSI